MGKFGDGNNSKTKRAISAYQKKHLNTELQRLVVDGLTVQQQAEVIESIVALIKDNMDGEWSTDNITSMMQKIKASFKATHDISYDIIMQYEDDNGNDMEASRDEFNESKAAGEFEAYADELKDLSYDSHMSNIKYYKLILNEWSKIEASLKRDMESNGLVLKPIQVHEEELDSDVETVDVESATQETWGKASHEVNLLDRTGSEYKAFLRTIPKVRYKLDADGKKIWNDGKLLEGNGYFLTEK